MKKAYFAGGCFWCITPMFKIYGVSRVTAGFSGGDEKDPSYEDVKSQKTGHRETLCLEYEPDRVSYETLLEIYFSNIDPFDEGGQYIDRGHSYTLAVFYTDATERKLAEEAVKAAEEESGRKVYVSIEPFKSFYAADEYHQDYYLKNPEAFEEELVNSGRKKAGGSQDIIDRTLGSLLEDPLISQIAPDAIRGRDLKPEEFYNWTLRKISDEMHWSNLERGFTRLLEAAKRGQYYYSLYSAEECEKEPSRCGVNLVRLPSDDPAADNRPYILIVPGGGFVNVWNLTEGWPVAQHFNARGYHAFILTYQIQVNASAARAMDDAARAVELIRRHSAEFCVDPDKYITCGFSAGGYIVCLWNTEKGYAAYGLPKPQACFPVYPVTSYRLMNESMEGSQQEKDDFARSASGCSMDETINSCFEIPEHVGGFPETALFLAAGDELVPPEHSKKLAAALDAAKIPCRLEIGETGGHGFSDGTGMCMEGWPERAIDWFEEIKKGGSF